jgi:hypothetical protein
MEGTGKMLTHNCTVEVEEALGTAAVEALTTPFPLHDVNGVRICTSSSVQGACQTIPGDCGMSRKKARSQ